MMEFKNYIHGQWQSTKNRIKKINPYDSSLLGEQADSDLSEVVTSIQACKKAFSEYEKTSLEERAVILNKIADQIEAQADELALQEAFHQGLSHYFVLNHSILFAAHLCRQTAKEITRTDLLPIKKEAEYSLHQKARPTGVISIIAAWPLCFRLVAERLVPALAAGNTCVVKVSQHSPITALLWSRILHSVGLPVGAVNFVLGRGEILGPVLAAHPGIQACSFAGSHKTGSQILKNQQGQMKKMQISMGAKNNLILLPDFDFQSNLFEILRAALVGQGQLAWNVQRIFVLENQVSQVKEVLGDFFSSLQKSHSPEEMSSLTPLISQENLEDCQKNLSKMISEHGKILYGGEGLGGNYFQPTVVVDLPNCSDLQQDELSGPLFILNSVKYFHEFAKGANLGYLGHSAVIWGPEEKAQKVADKLDVSKVWINTWMEPDDTIVGVRQSFYGNPDFQALGTFYSQIQNVSSGPLVS